MVETFQDRVFFIKNLEGAISQLISVARTYSQFLNRKSFIQMGLSTSFSDNNIPESLEPKQGDGTTPKRPTTTLREDVPLLEPKDTSLHSAAINKRDEELPKTKLYTAWVTDGGNEKQVNDTRDWLEELVKDKSQMDELRAFPWETEEDFPEDEIQKFWDKGKLKQEIDKFQRIYAWGGLVLDPAGYDTVSKKKEWIRDIQEVRKPVPHIPLPDSESATVKPGTFQPLQSRKDD